MKTESFPFDANLPLRVTRSVLPLKTFESGRSSICRLLEQRGFQSSIEAEDRPNSMLKALTKWRLFEAPFLLETPDEDFTILALVGETLFPLPPFISFLRAPPVRRSSNFMKLGIVRSVGTGCAWHEREIVLGPR